MPLSHHSSFPFLSALPMGNGQGNILFNLVVKKAEGCARRSSHGVGSGSFSSFFSFFSSFFSSLLEEEDDEAGAGSGGRSATT